MSAPDRSAELEQLIAEFEKSGLRELHVVRDGVEIYLSNDGNSIGLTTGVAPRPESSAVTGASEMQSTASFATAAPIPPTASSALDVPDGAEIICAPYLGTFYRAPKPGAEPYVEVGDKVAPESELCLVEVMKLFTTVRAGCHGTVHAILASDGSLVESDQRLFVIVKD